MRKLLSLLFVVTFLSARPQMPETDVWLFKIKVDNKMSAFTEGINFTSRAGYDNQPSFSADGKKIFYVSTREDKQADIYCYEINKKKILRVTNSPESEYSPVVTQDGKFLTAVVVETDSSQKIHFIEIKTGVHEKKINVDSVGYYTFMNTDTVVYYKLTQPHSLRYLSQSSGTDKFIASSPIRTLKAINRQVLIYGIEDSSSVVYYKYDFLLRKSEIYARSEHLNEDIFWHDNLGLLRSDGAQLFRYIEQEGKWILLFDLSAHRIKKISRFAIDAKQKYLVVVDNK